MMLITYLLIHGQLHQLLQVHLMKMEGHQVQLNIIYTVRKLTQVLQDHVRNMIMEQVHYHLLQVWQQT